MQILITESICLKLQSKSERRSQSYTLIVHEFGFTTGHGGIATYALERAKVLKSHGFDLSLICFETSFDKSQKELFSEIHFIPRGLTGARTAQWITKKLDELDPDVVETSDYQGWLSDYLIKSKLGLNKSRAFVDVRHHTATREIFEWNNFEDIGFAPVPLQTTHKLEIVQQRLADRNTFPSKFLFDYVSQFEPVPNSRIESYPLQIPSMAPTKVSVAPSPNMHIVSLGRLEKRKGLIHLVNALNHCENPISLTIVGNSVHEGNGDSYRRILSNIMSDELLAKTHFIDFMHKKNFKAFFETADLFVIPSPYENFPYAAIEGILHGIPIIVSKYSGLADFLSDNRLIFDPKDPQSLRGTIDKALELWKRNSLQEFALKQFSGLKSFMEENQFHSLSFEPEPVSTSRVVNWQLKTKLPHLKQSDSLLVSGKTALDIFSESLAMSQGTEDILVAFTNEHEVFSDLQEILEREIPFLLPLLTQEEVNSIHHRQFLGLLDVMVERDKVVSMVDPISKIATGIRVDYFGKEKFDFLRSRGGFR